MAAATARPTNATAARDTCAAGGIAGSDDEVVDCSEDGIDAGRRDALFRVLGQQRARGPG